MSADAVVSGDVRVAPGTLRRILERLDQEYEQNKLSCPQWVSFYLLKVVVYAIPVLAAAAAVSRTLPEAPFAAALGLTLKYALILAVPLLLANSRLMFRTIRHYKLTRQFHYRLADEFWGNRGRHVERVDAPSAVLAGIPTVLFVVFLLSATPTDPWSALFAVGLSVALFLVLRGLSVQLERYREQNPDLFLGIRDLLRQRREGWITASLLLLLLAASVIPSLGSATAWWTPPLVLALCIGLSLVLTGCYCLLEHPRRRLDFFRELRTVLRDLRHKVERAKGLPVTLKRSAALRLSDLDRMYVLSRRAEALLSLEEEGVAGYAMSMHESAMEAAKGLEPIDRLKVHMHLEMLSLEQEARQGGRSAGPWKVDQIPGTSLELLFTVDDASQQIHVRALGPQPISVPEAT